MKTLLLVHPEKHAGLPLLVDIDPMLDGVETSIHAAEEGSELIYRGMRRWWRNLRSGGRNRRTPRSTGSPTTGLRSGSSDTSISMLRRRRTHDPMTVHLMNETALLQVMGLQVGLLNTPDSAEGNPIGVGKGRDQVSAKDGTGTLWTTTSTTELKGEHHGQVHRLTGDVAPQEEYPVRVHLVHFSAEKDKGVDKPARRLDK